MSEKTILDMNEKEYAEWFKKENGYSVDEQVKCNKQFKKDLSLLAHKMNSVNYATDIYRALCNMRWKKVGIIPLYSCSWRYAGGMVAGLRNVGEDYMDFYCSGNESHVSEEVEKDMAELEWFSVPW